MLCDHIWQELQNNHAIIRLVYVVTQRSTCHGCVAKHSIYIIGAWEGMSSLKHNHYTGVVSIQPLGTQALQPYLVRTAKAPYHPQVGVYCYMNNNMSRICCHSFQIFCGCMSGGLQARNIINTLGSCSPKPQSTQSVGPDLVRTTKAPSHPQVVVYC